MMQGLQGIVGLPGPLGPPGYKGNAGPSGSTGKIGPPGKKVKFFVVVVATVVGILYYSVLLLLLLLCSDNSRNYDLFNSSFGIVKCSRVCCALSHKHDIFYCGTCSELKLTLPIEQGKPGFHGHIGPTGFQGPTGPRGPDGYIGSDGRVGHKVSNEAISFILVNHVSFIIRGGKVQEDPVVCKETWYS